MRHAWRLMTVAGGLYGTAIGIAILDPADAFVALIITGCASVIVGVSIAEMVAQRKERDGQGTD